MSRAPDFMQGGGTGIMLHLPLVMLLVLGAIALAVTGPADRYAKKGDVDVLEAKLDAVAGKLDSLRNELRARP